jgi:hypothetical protein
MTMMIVFAGPQTSSVHTMKRNEKGRRSCVYQLISVNEATSRLMFTQMRTVQLSLQVNVVNTGPRVV